MKREILKIGHPLLRKVARTVTHEELESPAVQRLIDDMIDTMHAARGAGLAAPQVGESVRICVAEVSSNERYPQMPPLNLRVWVNPQIEVLTTKSAILMYEGCLSVPGFRGQVERPAHIVVRSQDRDGKQQVDEFDDALAAVAGHEIDHLDGVLFVDRADSTTLCGIEEYARFVPAEERMQLVTRQPSTNPVTA